MKELLEMDDHHLPEIGPLRLMVHDALEELDKLVNQLEHVDRDSDSYNRDEHAKKIERLENLHHVLEKEIVKIQRSLRSK